MDETNFNPLAVKGLINSFRVEEDGVYSISAYLWSEQAKALQFVLSADRKEYFSENIKLTAEATRYEFQLYLPAQYYELSFRVVGDSVENLGSDIGDSFSVWGGQVEQGDTASPYHFGKPVEDQRQNYTALLVANILLFLLAASVVLHRNVRTVPVMMIALLAALSFAQVLIIVPEQRFVIAVQIWMWLLGLMMLCVWRQAFIVRRSGSLT